jgi:hypothetical protein
MINKELLNRVMKMSGVGRKKVAYLLKCSEQTARTLCMIRDNYPVIVESSPVQRVTAKGSKRYLVLGCVHVPFHNKALMNGIIDMLKANRFDGIVLAGDFLDMGALSMYDKGKVNKLNTTLEDEYRAANTMLDIFDTLLPKDAHKVLMFGNHENRYFRWLADVNNHKIGDLTEHTESELIKYHNIGYKSLKELKEVLTGLGLKLKQDD